MNYFIKRALILTYISITILVFTSFADRDKCLGPDISFVTFEPYLGEVAIFPYNFAPEGWIKCDGQILSINSFQALFSLLGTTYGGDGQTTFGVPDLRGRILTSHGNGPGLPDMPLGQKGGIASTFLSISNLPTHSHSTTIGGSFSVPVNKILGETDTDDPDGGHLGKQMMNHYSGSSTIGSGLAPGSGLSLSLANTGNGASFTNMPPYQALGYYIAVQGIFPSPN